MSRSPAIGRGRGVSSGSRSPPKGLRKNWSHHPSSGPDQPTDRLDDHQPQPPRGDPDHTAIRPASRPTALSKDVCRSLRAIPTFGLRWTHRTARPHDRSHAGSPQGFLTRRILPSSRCVWLTNTIDRIVKESGLTRAAHPRMNPGSRRRGLDPLPRSHSLDAIGRCEMPLSNSPRPSFGHRLCSRGKS